MIDLCLITSFFSCLVFHIFFNSTFFKHSFKHFLFFLFNFFHTSFLCLFSFPFSIFPLSPYFSFSSLLFFFLTRLYVFLSFHPLMLFHFLHTLLVPCVCSFWLFPFDPKTSYIIAQPLYYTMRVHTLASTTLNIYHLARNAFLLAQTVLLKTSEICQT